MPRTDVALKATPALVDWLSLELPRLGDGTLKWELLRGTGNLVYRIDRGGTPLVLRRPPDARPERIKVIAREAEVLTALNGRGVAAPRCYAYCADESILGAPFYVMEFIEGWRGTAPPPPFDKPGPLRRNLGFAMVDALADLAMIDYREAGLDKVGQPEGFLERQVDRWLDELKSYRQSENYPGRRIPGLEIVVPWLRDHIPPQQKPAILHGDFTFANVLMKNDPPGGVAAMIDWEMATVGDPLLDLGWLLHAFASTDESTPPVGFFDANDYPFREELAAHYAERTGRDVTNLTYYLVLAQFKLAVLLERQVARAHAGRLPREIGQQVDAYVLALIAKAAAMVRGDA